MPGDAAFLLRVYASTREGEMRAVAWSDADKAAFVDLQFRAQKKHYEEHYPSAAYLVIEVDGIAAGRLYVDRTASDINVLDIALLPEYRGRGVGRALLESIVDEARATRRTVSLYVEQYNGARRLYERLGFRALGSYGVYEHMRWAS
jgi:ribosomal protein S18 acetylase RimI-like enzyme